MSSVKTNILLNGINTVTTILFPVITFPYAARVLMPDGIGAVNFLNSIISYIVLLTSLGIPMYAVKEVAKYRDDIRLRNMVTVEILILSSFLCLCGYIAVWILAEYVPQIHRQQALFYVLSLTILFTGIGATWFYQGIEDFKFITIRALAIRTLAAASLFVFVKTPSDLIIYGFILVGSTVGNNIINLVHLKKHINFSSIEWKNIRIKRHIKPAFQVFILNLIISLYIQLNSIMLGFISGDEAVGYFTAGNKISHIGLTVISSLGTVLLPRCANLLQTGNLKGFASVIGKSLNVTLLLALPITVGLIILAVPTTLLFCGDDFEPAIPILYVTAPVVIFVSLTNLMGIQVLYPMNKVRIVIWSVAGGAILNIILNIILIPLYGALGAGVSTLIAEASVFAIQLFMGRNFYPFKTTSFFNWKIISATLIMGICVSVSLYFSENISSQVIIGISIGIVSYSCALLILQEKLFMEIILNLKNKLFHH